MVIADVDLNLPVEQHANGTVIPLNDQIRVAYDRVIHYADRRAETRASGTAEAAPTSAGAVEAK